jgi:hypothetical protein
MRRIPLRPDPKRPRRYINVRLVTRQGVHFRGTCYDAPALRDWQSRLVRVVPAEQDGTHALILDLRGRPICRAPTDP